MPLRTNVKQLLQYMGEDVTREGLLDTPDRFLRAWQEWTRGYHEDPAALFTTFEDGAEGCDEMIIVKDIPFYSHCEHHLTPFFGHASVAYIPEKKIVGLSKLARLVDIFAFRLQVQERLTNQVAGAIQQYLKPKGVAVMIEAEHLCMASRGVKKPGTSTITSALRGCFKTEPDCRAEFYSLIRR